MVKDSEELLTLMRKLAISQGESSVLLTSLDKKVDLHIQKTAYELKRITDQDKIQNDLLDKHIEGVNTLKAIYDKYAQITDVRLVILEQPRVWLIHSMKIFVGMGAICSAVAGVLKLFHLI